MKIWIAVMALMLTLSGCAEQDVFETVADEQAVPVMAQPRQIEVKLPGEAALPTS